MDQPTPQQQAMINLAILASQKLLKSLEFHEMRVADKYCYYDADNETRDYGIAVPRKFLHTRPGIGWASRCVNIMSDRLVFDGFANDTFGINDLFKELNAMPVINKAKHDALIGGCSFVAICDTDTPDADGNTKKLVPFTAMEATGFVDESTGMLKAGLAVTAWDLPTARRKLKNAFIAKDYIVFTPQYTAIFQNRELVQIVPNETGRTLLMPITRRQSANQPLGKSRITKTVRRIIGEVARLKRRQEIAGEFYSIPQRYISGLAEGAKKDPDLDAVIGKVWAITKDEDGDKPDVGQLAQMSIVEFTDVKKDLASDFCAETALTLRNLGYESGNPTSADSLSAMSDDLLLEVQNSQTEIGEQIKNIAITLRMSIDQTAIIADALKAMVPAWKPIFQIDLVNAGDAIFKILSVMPELQGTPQVYQMLGMGILDAEKLAAARAALPATAFMKPATGGTT